MNATQRFFYILTMLTTGLVAGVFFSEHIGITPVLLGLNASDYISIKQGLINSYNPAMPILGIGGSICYIIWLVLLKDYRKSKVFRYGMIGFVLLVISTLVTMFGELPANQQILALSAQTPSSNWEALRHLTVNVIAIRTVIMCLSFLFLTMASAYPLDNTSNGKSR